MCLYPKFVENPKYRANKKNGGNVPPLPFKIIKGKKVEDTRVTFVPVGCGKCMECRKKKAREWQIRLTEEVKQNRNGIFVTLTFSNESIKDLAEGIELDGYNRDNEIAKIAMRRFLERWRKKHKKSVRHWFITELGHNGTENIHMHGIIWTDIDRTEIDKHWKYGFTWIGKETDVVGERAVNYMIKYVSKTDLKHENYKPIILTSAGIGKAYTESEQSKMNKYKKGETREFYKNKKGYKIGLPIYYRNKIYSEEEREKLWQEKLDAGIRYVDGVEINIKTEKGQERYEKTRKSAREKSKRLGYGDNKIDWDKRIYENMLRNLKHRKRIENVAPLGSSPEGQADESYKIEPQENTDDIW